MKPLKLTIEGLHSFKERQEIDFEQLSDTGLFGIFGKTGSGKSTILDAITLALYGTVVRAVSRTQGILNSQCNKLEVSFSFAIGTGAERKVYRVERGFKRHKDRRDSVQATVCRLVEVNGAQDKIIAANSSEVTHRVETIIGLNMEDFTRSVVLPQGEFSQFLKLKDAERLRMLERIFALSDYGSRLTEKVKKERDNLVLQLELVERSIQEQGEVSEAQLTALRTKLAEEEAEQARLVAEAVKSETEFTAASQVWQLQTELEQIQEKLRLQQQKKNEIELKRAIFEKAQVAETLRPYLESSQKAKADLASSREEFQKIWMLFQTEQAENQRLSAEFAEVETLFFKRQPTLIAKRTEIQALLPIEVELQLKETELSKLQAETAKLTKELAQIQARIEASKAERDQKEQKQKEIEAEIRVLTVEAAYKEKVLAGVELEKEVDRLEQEVDRFETEKAEQLQQQQALEGEIREREAAARQLAQELEELQEKTLRQQQQKPGDLQSYAKRSSELNRLESGINQIIAIQAETEAIKFEVLKLMEVWNPAKENQVKLYKLIEQQQQKLARMEEVQVRLKEEIRLLEEQSLAARLAGELHQGAACPVCGSLQHPKPAKFDQTELEKKRTKMLNNETFTQTAREELERLNREFFQGQVQTEQYQNRYTELQEKISRFWEQLAELKQMLPSEIRENSPAKLKAYLQQKQAETENYRQTISDWEEQTKEIQAELGRVKEAKLAADHQVQQLNNQRELLSQTMEKIEAQLQKVQPELKQKQESLAKLRQELPTVKFGEEQKRILANERKLEALRQTIVKLTQELTGLDTTLSGWRNDQEQLSLKLHEFKTNERVLLREINESKTRVQAVTGDQKPREILAEIDECLNNLTHKYEYLKQRTEHSRSELQSLESRTVEARKKMELSQENLDHAQEVLDRLLLEKGFLNGNDFQNAMRSPGERAELKAVITEFDEMEKRWQHQIEIIQHKLDGRAVTAQQWEQLQARQQQLQTRKEELLGEISKQQTRISDLEQRLQKVGQYRKEQRGLARRKALVDEIFKLLQGDAFVAYIAEEQMRYILWDASRRLEMLTGSRYALRMDDNKDFVVADNSNGGIVRPVSSLSGGETFLVSLSLALALSGKIQLNGKHPLEFFFLDEGFGTLDPQLLEVVMDCLERLRQENLTIGVISHMPELRSRISRRLIVTPASPGGAGSRIRIEKA